MFLVKGEKTIVYIVTSELGVPDTVQLPFKNSRGQVEFYFSMLKMKAKN